MTVFQYLQDKDVFSKIYRNYLQRRLINMNSIGDDDEDLMLKKLSDKCGQEYTTKMHRMMQDTVMIFKKSIHLFLQLKPI